MGDEHRPRTETLGALVGVLFWVAVIGAGLFVYFHEEPADLFLSVSKQPPAASGEVLFGGRPVASGRVQLSVSRVEDGRLLGSRIVPVGADGRFEADLGAIAEHAAWTAEGLRVGAQFRGLAAASAADEAPQALSAEAAIWVNTAPPGLGHVEWSFLAATGVLVLVLIVLFTGEIRKRKARLLFSMMYFLTFLSLVTPIALTVWVGQSDDVLAVMKDSPVGLIKGTARGVAEPQWLLNVGGSILTEGDPPVARVSGGLAVPFYVLLLAMFGAGINMTRRIPEIQRKYYEHLPESDHYWFARVPLFGSLLGQRAPPDGDDQAKAAGIRTDLVRNFMYVLSAPFLAIAVYYLLQIVASEVAQPVLVVMAFATGLVSDTIVGSIVGFAEQKMAEGSLIERRGESATYAGAERRAPAPAGAPDAAAAEPGPEPAADAPGGTAAGPPAEETAGAAETPAETPAEEDAEACAGEDAEARAGAEAEAREDGPRRPAADRSGAVSKFPGKGRGEKDSA